MYRCSNAPVRCAQHFQGLFKKHCGECCMNPKDYKLYHFFERNLTKSAVDSPCKVLYTAGQCWSSVVATFGLM